MADASKITYMISGTKKLKIPLVTRMRVSTLKPAEALIESMHLACKECHQVDSRKVKSIGREMLPISPSPQLQAQS